MSEYWAVAQNLPNNSDRSTRLIEKAFGGDVGANEGRIL